MSYPYPTGNQCYPDNDAGKAAVVEDNCGDNMFDDYTSGGLFDLVWRGGRREVVEGTLEVEELTASCLRSSPRFKPPLQAYVAPELPLCSPSEDEMAEWLYGTIKGQDHAHDCGGSGWTDYNGWHAPFEKSSETSMPTQATSLVEKNEMFPTAEGTVTKESGGNSTSSKTRENIAGIRSHHGATHRDTEKRRRCKINERLKTLQHLVPRCDKFCTVRHENYKSLISLLNPFQSSYSTTLEHTIQYMKTLREQIQVLGGGPSCPAAVHPIVRQYVPPTPPLVTLAPMAVLGPSPMVSFGPALPLAHYLAPVPVVMVPAATTTASRLAPPRGNLGQESSGSVRWKE